MNRETNLCCVRQHKAGRGQTGHGSHRWCSQGHCTPYLRMVCREREKISSLHASVFPFTYSFHFYTDLTVQRAQICACTCSAVRVSEWLQRSSLRQLCSAPSALALYTSPSPPSLSLCTHRHTLCTYRCK